MLPNKVRRLRAGWEEGGAWQEGCRCILCMSTFSAQLSGHLESQNSVLHRAYAARRSWEIGVANMQSMIQIQILMKTNILK